MQLLILEERVTLLNCHRMLLGLSIVYGHYCPKLISHLRRDLVATIPDAIQDVTLRRQSRIGRVKN